MRIRFEVWERRRRFGEVFREDLRFIERRGLFGRDRFFGEFFLGIFF
jgi:hypothetical protein